MKSSQTLNSWIRSKYNSNLLRTVWAGVLVTFSLCLVTGYYAQFESIGSTTEVFSHSLRNWVTAGDLLQIKQATGQLIDAHTIDFAVVRDTSNRTIYTNDPLKLRWQPSEGQSVLANGNIVQIYCRGYDTLGGVGDFCFGKRLTVKWFILIGAFLSLFYGLVTVMLSKQSKKLSSLLVDQLITIRNVAIGAEDAYPLNHEINEVAEVVGELGHFKKREAEAAEQNQKLKIQLEQKRIDEQVGRVASQVAHDIRSPLAALGAVLGGFEAMPEEERAVLQSAVGRIKEIAGDLLKLSRPPTQVDSFEYPAFGVGKLHSFSVERIGNLINSIVDEKKVQYGDIAGLSIERGSSITSNQAFVAIDSTEFQRVLSNLFNNAVESLTGAGRVEVNLVTSEREVRIQIVDNGAGIPNDILSSLTLRGATYGKLHGNGLGLFHARACVESWKGALEIRSEVGVGTSVTVVLPVIV